MAGLAIMFILASVQTDQSIDHPEVPCWKGHREWTEPGKPVSQNHYFDTKDDVEPFEISHDRDTFYEGTELQQDYNFINYLFGDESDPLYARHYLNSREVSIILPESAGIFESSIEAQKSISPSVLCYLKKRFSKGSVLLEDGYMNIWGGLAE